MSIDLNCLTEDAQLASGDPLFCNGCSAIFNNHSKVDTSKDAEDGTDDQTWTCEFCNQINEVVLEPEEIPTKDTVNYIIEAEKPEENVEEEKEKQNDSETPLIFCIDISGSMSTSASGRASVQNRRFGARQKSTLSRLQCIKNAILAQLQTMTEIKRKVGVVTFENNVEIIGDGTQGSAIISKILSLL